MAGLDIIQGPLTFINPEEEEQPPRNPMAPTVRLGDVHVGPEYAQPQMSADDIIASARQQVDAGFQRHMGSRPDAAMELGKPSPTPIMTPQPPRRSGPPSIYDPSPAEEERYQREMAAGLGAPTPSSASPMAQQYAKPGMEVEQKSRFGQDALAAAMERRDQENAVSGLLSGLTQAFTGGMANTEFQPSTALQDYMAQRQAAIEDRNRELLEQRQATQDGREAEVHQSKMRELQQQFEAAEQDEAQKAELADPNSNVSERARQTYQTLGEELGMANISELIEGRSAADLRESPEFQSIMEYASRRGLIEEQGLNTRYGLRNRRLARGGGGFIGGSGRGGGGDELREAVVSQLIDNGLTEQQARRSVVGQGTRQLRSLLSGATNRIGGGNAAEAKLDREGRNDLQRLGKAMSGLSNVRSALDLATEQIDQLGVEDLSLAERAAVQGVMQGGVVGALSGNASDRARAIGSTINELGTAILREESGAAISESEWEGMRQRLGVAAAQGPGQFREAVDRIRQMVDRRVRDVRAGYAPSVQETYDRNVESSDPPASARRQRPGGSSETRVFRLRFRGEVREGPLTQQQLRQLIDAGAEVVQ